MKNNNTSRYTAGADPTEAQFFHEIYDQLTDESKRKAEQIISDEGIKNIHLQRSIFTGAINHLIELPLFDSEKQHRTGGATDGAYDLFDQLISLGLMTKKNIKQSKILELGSGDGKQTRDFYLNENIDATTIDNIYGPIHSSIKHVKGDYIEYLKNENIPKYDIIFSRLLLVNMFFEIARVERLYIDLFLNIWNKINSQGEVVIQSDTVTIRSVIEILSTHFSNYFSIIGVDSYQNNIIYLRKK